MKRLLLLLAAFACAFVCVAGAPALAQQPSSEAGSDVNLPSWAEPNQGPRVPQSDAPPPPPPPGPQPPPGPPGSAPQVPLGGLEWLALAGGAYAARRLAWGGDDGSDAPAA